MACSGNITSDAAKFVAPPHDPQVYDECGNNVLKLLEEFTDSELKTMFFLLMTDVCDKQSLNNYLELVMKKENLKFIFCKKWHEEKFNRNDLIELLGVMKKFKHLKNLGVCKHTFRKNQNSCSRIPEICKLFFSVCEELDDEEIKTLQHSIFPGIYKDLCGEELICLMLFHGNISSNDFSQLKQALLAMRRKDLITKMEVYENRTQPILSSDPYPIRQPTSQKPSGLAVVINEKNFTECEQIVGKRLCLEERKGSGVDCRKLENLWRDFGFKVESHINLTSDEILRLPQDLQFRDLSSYDIFTLCIMSHGQKGSFYSSDSKLVDIDSLIGNIADSCMIGKPKLIFVQACQGDQHNEGVPIYPKTGVQRKLVTDSRPQREIVPRLADILKVLATIDNHVSYRDEREGSLFISHLVKNISEYGHKEDIQAVLTRVKNGISKENAEFDGKLYKQIPISSSTLRRMVLLKRVST